MIFSTVPDKASSDSFTDSLWEDSVRRNITNLMTPPAVIVGNFGFQAIPTGIGNTPLTISFAELDTDLMYGQGAENHVKVNTAGLYHLSMSAIWTASTAGTIRAIYVGNGSSGISAGASAEKAYIRQECTNLQYASTYLHQQQQCQGSDHLSEASFMRMTVNQDSGDYLAVQRWRMGAIWLGRNF